MIPREHRFHDDPNHFSNWCRICGLYFCWHAECSTHAHSADAVGHPFTPMRNERDFDERICRQITIECPFCHISYTYHYNPGLWGGENIDVLENHADPDDGYYTVTVCPRCRKINNQFHEEHLP